MGKRVSAGLRRQLHARRADAFERALNTTGEKRDTALAVAATAELASLSIANTPLNSRRAEEIKASGKNDAAMSGYEAIAARYEQLTEDAPAVGEVALGSEVVSAAPDPRSAEYWQDMFPQSRVGQAA